MGVKVGCFGDLALLRGYKENFFTIKDFRKFFIAKKFSLYHLASIFHINRDFQISISHEKISILAKNEFFFTKMNIFNEKLAFKKTLAL